MYRIADCLYLEISVPTKYFPEIFGEVDVRAVTNSHYEEKTRLPPNKEHIQSDTDLYSHRSEINGNHVSFQAATEKSIADIGEAFTKQAVKVQYLLIKPTRFRRVQWKSRGNCLLFWHFLMQD